MGVLTRLVAENPVLVKEMRTRMRGTRAYWILAGYLLLLSLILFVRYTLWWHEAQARGGLSAQSKIGQEFFSWILVTQGFLVAFITPALTSGAITIEREQRTMEMLEMTRLTRGAIVGGKLLSALGFVALLLVSSLPLTSICFFLGGVSPEQVLYAYVMLLAASFVAGCLGLVWSAVARTTSAAVLYTYASMLAPVLVLFVYMGLSSAQVSGYRPSDLLMSIAIMGLYGFRLPELPCRVGAFLNTWDMRHYYGLTLPTWLAPVLSYVLIGSVLAVVAMERLEPRPGRRSSLLRWLVAAFIFQQAFFFFGARFSVYSGTMQAGFLATLGGYPLLSSLTYPLLLLLICIPIFSTGEVRPTDARRFAAFLAQGWTPSGWRRGSLASGLPFLALLSVIVLGLYALSFAFIGQPGAAVSGKVNLSGVPSGIPGGGPYGTWYSGAGWGAATAAPDSAQLPKAAAAVLATVLGLSALGLLSSLIVRNRWAAMGIAFAILAAILVAPVVSLINYQNDPGRGPPSILINLFYMNPLTCINDLSGGGLVSGRAPLLFTGVPVWMVTTAGYLLLTGVSLLFAVPFVAQTAARRPAAYE